MKIYVLHNNAPNTFGVERLRVFQSWDDAVTIAEKIVSNWPFDKAPEMAKVQWLRHKEIDIKIMTTELE